MNGQNQEIEFSVLGFNVKFKPDSDEQDGSIPAHRIVEYVHKEAAKIKSRAPSLNEGQVAILLALQLASEKMQIEQDFRVNIEQLQSTARDALAYVEEIYPNNHHR